MNLAIALESYGKKVGLLDADIYGPSSKFENKKKQKIK